MHQDCSKCRGEPVTVCSGCYDELEAENERLTKELQWLAGELLRQPKYRECSVTGVITMVKREAHKDKKR